MKFRFITFVIGGMLSLFSLPVNAQGFDLLIDSVEVQGGQDVCVGIRAKGYIELISLQFVLSWDAQVIALKQTKNYNLPGMSATDFSYSQPNHLIFAWADPAAQCVSKDSGEILFEVCFSAIGPVGTSSFITIDTGEAGICLGQFISVPFGSDTGLVIISAQSGTSDVAQGKLNAFQLAPNPTSSGTHVILQSMNSDNSLLIITDALQRIVYEQKVTVEIGENTFEIPAYALRAKGMYQVSLQTKEGVSSQILSVN